jgi:hypothetical protein
MATPWTADRKAKQAVLIRTWRPWERSTGPRTAAGRAKASRNAWKGGHWQQMRELSRAVNEEIRVARELVRASVARGVPMGKAHRPREC